MSTRSWLTLGLLLALAAGAGAATYLTGGVDPLQPMLRRGAAAAAPPVVDQSPLQTARLVAALATTGDEQDLSREMVRLADHEVDLAFADALREAKAHPAPLPPQARALAAHLDSCDAAVSADQAIVKGVTAALADAHGAKAEELQGELELAQAQLAIDQDAFDDAREDLNRAGGDPLGRIQHLLDEHEAAQHTADATATAAPAPIAFNASDLVTEVRSWIVLRQHAQLLSDARADATSLAASLVAAHNALESKAPSDTAPADTANQAAAAEAAAATASLAKRSGDEQDLADAYGSWLAIVSAQQRTALHGASRSALWILLTVVVVYISSRLIDRSLTAASPEQRGRQAVRVAIRFAIQLIGAALILFVVFGTPSQTPTILGLAGAGLTVALKDFILAFLGWFVLMGRNGIRVGDWVEIKGVGGEVVEIGLFRTVLLETGSWTDSGHPTGRRVTFVNSYAVEGHYFNFSTSGRWLWDELKVVVPAGGDVRRMIDAIQAMVSAETEANGRIAEQEWQRANSRYRVKAFSTAPALQVRPTPEGIEVVARYMTRAHERQEVRTRLYQQIVDLLHDTPAKTA